MESTPASQHSVIGQAVPSWRAAVALLRLRFRRLFNIATVACNFGRPPRGAAKKQVGVIVITGLMVPMMVLWGVGMAFAILHGAREVLGPAKLTAFVGLQLLILSIGMVAMELGLKKRDLARGDWDMEWLLALPVSVSGLMTMKVVEYTALNGYAWVFVFPMLMFFGWEFELGWLAVGLSALFTLMQSLLVSVSRVVLETCLRRFCSPGFLRNFQAVCTMVGMAPLMLFIVLATGAARADHFIWTWFHHLTDWPLWLPTGLPAVALEAGRAGFVGWGPPTLLLVVGGALGLWVVWRLVALVLREGIISGTGTLQARGGEPAKVGEKRRADAGISIMGKDFLLLLRDRRILLGTLIFPAAILSLQFLVNPALVDSGFGDPKHAATLAFCVGAYVLMFTAVRVLTSEGKALWLLFTVPQPLHDLLRKKALFWAGLASIYSLAVLVYAYTVLPWNARLFEFSFFALAGIFVVALLASAMGIFGYNPHSPNPQQQVRIGHVYLAMLLVGCYNWGFYAPSTWDRIQVFVSLSLLALGLWQRLERELPFILDSVARPAPRLELTDGLGAAFLYIVFVNVMLRALTASTGMTWFQADALAVGIGGGLVVVVTLWYLFLRRLEGLLENLALKGFQPLRAWLPLLVGTPLCALVLVGFYRLVGEHARARGYSVLQVGDAVGEVNLVFGLLAIGLFPWIQELIFRGLVFRRLRQGFGFAPAMLLSALVYALAQHPLHAVPMFFLGLGTAWACERGGLYAAVLLHAGVRAVLVLWG